MRSVALLIVVAAVVVTTALPTAVAGPRPASVSGASGLPGATAARPAAPAATFNPPCATVTPSVCVSLADATEPNIIPANGNTTATVTPPTTANIPLIVKSKTGINWTGSAVNGPDCPVALNLTANLWNGAPFYSQLDGTTWHASSPTWYLGPLTGVTNKTYPYWYEVNITAIGPNNVPEFQPGMYVSWWISLTYNESGVIRHIGNTTVWHFTYAGAWPWSPYAPSAHSAGTAAFGEDVALAQQPSAPNWNDSIGITLNTTAADLGTNATLGSSFLKVDETLNGTYLQSAVYSIAKNLSATYGLTSMHYTIPTSFAQRPGAKIAYQVGATDFLGGDQVLSPVYTYTVNGNGSFPSGYFATDLALVSSPNVGATNVPWAGTLLAPGVPVRLTLASRNAPDAINQAEAVYTVVLPELGTATTRSVPFVRVNSTVFTGELPAMPLGAEVNYTVLAWDFTSHLEVAPGWNYTVASLADVVPSVPGNQTFFYVAVYDAGAGRYVNGASVSIRSAGGYVHSFGTTFDGLAYPNATGSGYAPLVVPANATYAIAVSGAGLAATSVNWIVGHAPGGHAILALGSGYSVVQQGNMLLFWMNGTVGTSTDAPSETTVLEIGSAVGLLAVAVTIVPLYAWWKRIEARREAELKRVTL